MVLGNYSSACRMLTIAFLMNRKISLIIPASDAVSVTTSIIVLLIMKSTNFSTFF